MNDATCMETDRTLLQSEDATQKIDICVLCRTYTSCFVTSMPLVDVWQNFL